MKASMSVRSFVGYPTKSVSSPPFAPPTQEPLPASGPWHWLFSLLRTLLPHPASWLILPPHTMPLTQRHPRLSYLMSVSTPVSKITCFISFIALFTSEIIVVSGFRSALLSGMAAVGNLFRTQQRMPGEEEVPDEPPGSDGMENGAGQGISQRPR